MIFVYVVCLPDRKVTCLGEWVVVVHTCVPTLPLGLYHRFSFNQFNFNRASHLLVGGSTEDAVKTAWVILISKKTQTLFSQ